MSLCYRCQYRRSIPGNAHSRCAHPALGAASYEPGLAFLFVLAGQEPPFHVKGHPHGIRKGWFIWPANFDPAWLLECDGFTTAEGRGCDAPSE